MVSEEQRVVTASRDIAAPAELIFELIADPSRQPRWDGNDNLSEAEPGQRVRAVGDVFTMTLTPGQVRENHVSSSSRAAASPGGPPRPAPAPGHLWRWVLEPIDAAARGDAHLRLDAAHDEKRLRRARAPR